MKIDLVDMDAKIQELNAQEVSDPVFFESGFYPREDGLFSYIIFGDVGTSDRRTKFGYIDLKHKFLSPVAFKAMKDLDRNIESVIMGDSYFSINSEGFLVPDDTSGETGIQFLYDNFEKIKFKDTGSRTRRERIDLLKNIPKDRLFIDKFLVIPAYYRDFNPDQSTSSRIQDTDELNTDYSSIIRKVDSLSGNSFGFINDSIKFEIQELLYDIYIRFTDNELSKKRGLIQENLLGKNIDYSVRSVITAPKVNSEKWDNQDIPYGYLGVPLAQLLSLFYPFFVKYINDFIEIHKDSFTKLPGGEFLSLEQVYAQYSEREIRKMLDMYMSNINERFNPITVVNSKGSKVKVKIYNKDLKRDFTVTDLLYIAAVDICTDKHVLYSRYPIENHLNVSPAKIKILTTNQTIPEVKLADRYLKNYPIVVTKYPVPENLFIDSAVINNSYTKALGADFDGDQVSIRSIWTVEGNREADELLNKKTNILDYTGKNTRTISNDGIMSLYSLTKE